MTKNKNTKPTSKKSGRRPKVIEHPVSSESFFTNRELGWLNFNKRVLNEAEDSRTPLLERLKFLSIVNSNLDEFFMKRVGGLKRQVSFNITSKSSDGKTADQQLFEIRKKVQDMVKDQGRVFSQVLKPALKKEGIKILKWAELTPQLKEKALDYYRKNVFPVLTPLSVDPGHPFPFISNLSTSLGITLKHPKRDDILFARVKVPSILPQWIHLATDNTEEYVFVSLVELVKENLKELFPLMQVIQVMPFRLTRNAEILHEEDDAEDLLSMIEEELRMRKFADVVRLEHGPNPDPWILNFLMEELELLPADIYELPEEFDLDYCGFNTIAELNIPKLRYEPLPTFTPFEFQDESSESFFSAIRSHDRLVYHPFENFSQTTEKFLRLASEDPKVVAIKMTLYRTSVNSHFIQSLIRASEQGKQVVCLIELKARFDEQRNIFWAQELENAGVHVVYGIIGLKTHAKTALIVRHEHDGLKCYAHIGTGNYNSVTSRFYTDFGFLTADDRITSELVGFFNFLTGRSLKKDYENLLIAPVNMFGRIIAMIEREIEHVKNKRPAQILVKMNSMEENDIALHLFKASQAGVNIEMHVRGFCCLRPGVKGLSENIKVVSTIGRLLEHARLFYFRNGAIDPVDGDFFIGSADWMYRNLHARVECITPIYNRSLKEKLWEIIQIYSKDQRQTWEMKSDGRYEQRKGTTAGAHSSIMDMLKKNAELDQNRSNE